MTISFNGLLKTQLTNSVYSYYNANQVETIMGTKDEAKIKMQSTEDDPKKLPTVYDDVNKVAKLVAEAQKPGVILDLDTLTIDYNA